MLVKRRKRHFWLLVFSFLLLVCLLYLIINFDPTRKFPIFPAKQDLAPRDSLQFSLLPIFFVLVFLSTLTFSAYLLNNSRRGLFIALLITSYLLLRFFHLTHIFFLILLIALFFTLELLFRNRK
jgi:hypothetical protein